MINKYLSFSISITVISWMVGMIINAVLKKTAFYNQNLSNLNFIKSGILNKMIGLHYFKWIVKNTFFKFFNQKIKLDLRIDYSDLNKIRSEMTSSEIDHLIGFVFVAMFASVKFYNFNFTFGLIMMVVNLLMNLYPSLLQQENKRRIDRLINVYSRIK
jgi:hypothetical protein